MTPTQYAKKVDHIYKVVINRIGNDTTKEYSMKAIICHMLNKEDDL